MPEAGDASATPTQQISTGSASADGRPFRLDFAALSDVGRVRKDNQDSGYAGPWLLTVCDGVGGAARGDIASSTAVHTLRKLDEEPAPGLPDDDLIGMVSHALHMAHDEIGHLVEHDPSLSGTSTTSTVGLFDGAKLSMGHVGDSRAYLLRNGAIHQITHDHTFVQTLLDEGRITEDEAKTHPHRNLILKALDGTRELEPDLFIVDLAAGDRLMLCSDGVCGSVPDPRIADILATGTPDYAAVELVRVALDSGSTDNVTCVVADVVPAEQPVTEEKQPQLVGAAAELRRKVTKTGQMSALFLGHRRGDTGELEPVSDEIPDDAIATDPEELRYALKEPARFLRLRWIFGLIALLGVVWIIGAVAWVWSQNQWYVGEQGGHVTIYRGLNTTLGPIDLSKPYQSTNLKVSDLSEASQDLLDDGIHMTTLKGAKEKVQDLANDTADDAGSGS
ncbi:MAG: serine/threonine-protein phosphatase [Nocardioides sp.]|nr:serine/threonine-protein phosphatase [Nocardioides sp.]